MTAVVDLHDNTISLYEEGDTEPIAIIGLQEVIIRAKRRIGEEKHGYKTQQNPTQRGSFNRTA